LPPVVVDASGSASLLETVTDLPLGAHRGAVRRTTQVPLTDSDGVLFYTDGLIERRGRMLSEGIDALLAGLEAGSAEELCGRATASMLGDQPAADDVAVLALRRLV
jgi:serine phosphatase RsbU (regulator of sigma subunit)